LKKFHHIVFYEHVFRVEQINSRSAFAARQYSAVQNDAVIADDASISLLQPNGSVL
jgi:hypothetical protein